MGTENNSIRSRPNLNPIAFLLPETWRKYDDPEHLFPIGRVLTVNCGFLSHHGISRANRHQGWPLANDNCEEEKEVDQETVQRGG